MEDSRTPNPSPIGFPIFPKARGHPSPRSGHRGRSRALLGLATGEVRFLSSFRAEWQARWPDISEMGQIHHARFFLCSDDGVIRALTNFGKDWCSGNFKMKKPRVPSGDFRVFAHLLPDFNITENI